MPEKLFSITIGEPYLAFGSSGFFSDDSGLVEFSEPLSAPVAGLLTEGLVVVAVELPF